MAASDPATWLARHGNALYRYALLRTRDAAQAEDLVQETFLAALKARDRYAGQSSEQTWLIGILKHKLIDHFRARGHVRQEQELLDDDEYLDTVFSPDGHWARPPVDWDGPDGALEAREFWRVFRTCLHRLPAHLADLFILRELNELPSEDVCKVMEISTTNNMWVMLSRARLRLRQCLDQHWFQRNEAQGA